MTPRFHQSTAHTLLTQSPYHAWYWHDDLGGNKKQGTDAQVRGTVLDRMLFNVGPEIVVLDFDDYKSKAAKAAKDEATAAGKLPVLLDTYERYRLFVEAVIAQLADEHGLVLNGQSQVEVEWDSPHGVACAGRIDHLFLRPRILILDLKTCLSAAEDAVVQSIVKHGGHIQYAAYTEAARVLFNEEPEMKFIFAESTAPFAVRLAPLAGTMKSLGEYEWRRACGIWKECLRTNTFPGYPVTRIEAKPWQLAKAVENGDEDMDLHD